MQGPSNSSSLIGSLASRPYQRFIISSSSAERDQARKTVTLQPHLRPPQPFPLGVEAEQDLVRPLQARAKRTLPAWKRETSLLTPGLLSQSLAGGRLGLFPPRLSPFLTSLHSFLLCRSILSRTSSTPARLFPFRAVPLPRRLHLSLPSVRPLPLPSCMPPVNLSSRLPTPTESEYARALHDFVPVSGTNTCLSFEAGQVIRTLNKDASGWWDGELEGKRGWFPSNYVEVYAVGAGDDAEEPVSRAVSRFFWAVDTRESWVQ